MNIDEIIEGLKNLDLSKYPEDEIRFLINQLGPLAHMSVSYHKGKTLMRARPNYGDEKFRTKKDFSFKPQEYNSTYQRASTPYYTMFYGATIPDKIEPGELDVARIIGLLETLSFTRNPEIQKGYQRISYGRWEVVEDINLLAIIHNDSFHGESGFIRELYDDYQKNIIHAPSDIQEKSQKFLKFLAEEFGKENIKGDYDYMISAIFSEMTANMGLDGILYPSVRTLGKGFNLALTPEATKKMKLVVAGECSAVKFDGTTYLGNDAIAELSGHESDDEQFEMKPLDHGVNRILAQLGLTDINQLIPKEE
jgi:hypothetical protein